MTDQELFLFFCVCILVVIYFANQKREKSSDGLLNDNEVSVEKIKEILTNFEPNWNSKLKSGYTENSIEKDLKIYLQSNVRHITTQYALEGAGSKIDFDLGDGSVGLEIKLANAVFKASQQDRMVGQLHTYSDKKYISDNLILAIFCTDAQMQERLIKKQIVERLNNIDCEVLFLPAPTNT